ncbi:MAG TPA: primosomal protein N' [Rectinemataceae bacterium]|nr:primosomal protein N' [Rectinemataceae bacterium]
MTKKKASSASKPSPGESRAGSEAMTDAYLRIAFPLPIDDTYWYRNNDEKPARMGCRAEAPFGRRGLAGFVVETAPSCALDPALVKPIKRVVDAEAIFAESTVSLAAWVARMYFCSLGEALGAMLPTGRRESLQASAEIEDFQIGDKALPLMEEQRAALDGVLASESGTTYLYGPTGTGKTEVFLQAAERTLAEGRSVIYLVPEIALTGQVIRSARQRFGDACAVIHSRLTPSQKLSEWRRILKGEAHMVIGARSAIFAPLKNLGLIVIDEEHEGSYKAGNTPRYHARQVAMYRAGKEKARLILGSATPSVEAWHSCEIGAMNRQTLSQRPGGGDFPKIEVVDMRTETSTISGTLKKALIGTKAEGRQSILFLNRRGFSHFFVCDTCGAELKCKHCSVALTYHKEQNQLICHYCGYRTPPPKACPECSSLDIGWRGFGTERVEEEVAEQFPDWTIRRLDADTVSKRGSLESTLEEFRSGKIDILLGTQMVAKGLNFPGVKTVGVVLADAGLNLPDFRAAERVFSLIVQVAGRAGRYDPDGRVFIQTFRPDNPVIELASALDMKTFYAWELSLRRAQGFPPFCRMARIVVRSRDRDRCVGTARELARKSAALLPPDVELLGPAECALGMIAGSQRWQILLRAPSLSALHAAMRSLLEGYKAPSSVHLEVDIDPVQLL